MVNKVAITALALAPPATARAQAGADGVNLVRLCEKLAQEVTRAENGQRVLKIALQTMGDGVAGPTVLKPFGLDLATAITPVIGETAPH
jgi:invasion protein IalB